MLRSKSIFAYFALIFISVTSFRFVNSTESVIDDNKNAKFIYIFAHGLGSTLHHVNPYRACGVIPKSCNYLSKNGPEVGNGGSASSVLAQDDDIDVVIDEIKEATETYGNECAIILVGVSKGAATMINTVGKLAATKSNYLKNIKAVILDSPFADANDVACDVICPKFANYSPVKSSLKVVLKVLINKVAYKNYDPYGIQPINAIKEQWKDVNKDMLIVFFHSKDDLLINVRHSKLLSNELKTLGFKNTYFIQTTFDVHANIFWGYWSEFTLSRLWCIYKKYGLPVPSISDFADNKILSEDSIKIVFNNLTKMSDEEIDKFVEGLRNGISTETAS